MRNPAKPRNPDFDRMEKAYAELQSALWEVNAFTQELHSEHDCRRRAELAGALSAAYRSWEVAYAAFEDAMLRLISSAGSFSSAREAREARKKLQDLRPSRIDSR